MSITARDPYPLRIEVSDPLTMIERLFSSEAKALLLQCAKDNRLHIGHLLSVLRDKHSSVLEEISSITRMPSYDLLMPQFWAIRFQRERQIVVTQNSEFAFSENVREVLLNSQTSNISFAPHPLYYVFERPMPNLIPFLGESPYALEGIAVNHFVAPTNTLLDPLDSLGRLHVNKDSAEPIHCVDLLFAGVPKTSAPDDDAVITMTLMFKDTETWQTVIERSIKMATERLQTSEHKHNIITALSELLPRTLSLLLGDTHAEPVTAKSIRIGSRNIPYNERKLCRISH